MIPHDDAPAQARPADPPASQRGLFLAFEGGDGVGKSTQVGLLAEHLRSRGLDVVVTREPGDSRIGAEVRAILLDGGDLDARAEALLFAADRADHVASVVRPALERGAVVITDRYVDSSVAYQGVGRALGVEQVTALSDFAIQGLVPDLTIVLDLDPEERRRRVENLGEFDRIEREPDHVHGRIRQAFLDLARQEPDRYVVVDAAQNADHVAAEIAAEIEKVMA